jgi:2-C-methyl-D-erythritol 4-phosphate cytidylyltransferase
MAAAIIVAAGKGRRMAGRVPKQYLDLNGQPVVAHTLKVFDACDLVEALILVVAETDFDFCRKAILQRLALRKKVLLTAGGRERQDSVYRGLLCAAEVLDNPSALVAIHDGVRPLVSVAQVTACIRQARVSGACILGLPVVDTLKQVDERDHISTTLAREAVWMAQTPQVFRLDLILRAHEGARKRGIAATDDAELVERLGVAVGILRGGRQNFKITTADDLEMARSLLSGADRPLFGA